MSFVPALTSLASKRTFAPRMVSVLLHVRQGPEVSRRSHHESVMEMCWCNKHKNKQAMKLLHAFPLGGWCHSNITKSYVMGVLKDPKSPDACMFCPPFPDDHAQIQDDHRSCRADLVH